MIATLVCLLSLQEIPPPPAGLPRKLETKRCTIHTDLDEKALDFYGRVFEGFWDRFEADWYKVPEAKKKLPIYLFSKGKDYTDWTKSVGGPAAALGYYWALGRDKYALVVNLQSGLGTATHEFVHHFVNLGFDGPVPAWMNEGFAAFHEKFMGYMDAAGKLVVSFGYFSNWRFPAAKRGVESYSLEALLAAKEVDTSAARSLMLFLHKRKLLKKLIDGMRARKDDARGAKALEAAWGQPLADLEKQWKDWIRSQPVDDDVKLVPASFIKTEAEWKEWWKANEARLEWSEEEKRYRPKKR